MGLYIYENLCVGVLPSYLYMNMLGFVFAISKMRHAVGGAQTHRLTTIFCFHLFLVFL